MPNIGALLKEEIRRLAKREARALMASVRKDNARLKRTAAEHKRRLARLERDNRRLVAESDARLAEGVKASPEEVAQARIGAARVRALRKRLRLSQAELGQILGVSGKTVLLWEKKEKLHLRDKARAAVVSAMKLNAKEARRKLELMAPKVVAKKKRKVSQKRRR